MAGFGLSLWSGLLSLYWTSPRGLAVVGLSDGGLRDCGTVMTVVPEGFKSPRLGAAFTFSLYYESDGHEVRNVGSDLSNLSFSPRINLGVYDLSNLFLIDPFG
ncbi:hypothetical protein Nepgr_008022 [Nepenthes gracilis]|uniref:Uncharacterized protein n=1 Tax=Nepenthes gracilis TaxID=150966 RepID=A0AAD3S8T3_NEPGR|nr:hypothetical protein Nepgr_008022 [Nepenthes gracilis]